MLGDRRARALARLADASGECWYFALVGLDSNLEQFEFDPAVRLARVTDPPTEAELAAALREPRLFAALGRFTRAVRYEVIVERKLGATPEMAMTLAAPIVAALRIRTGGDLLLAAFSDCSWSAIAGIVDGRCTAGLLEDVPHVRRLAQPAMVKLADLEWVWPRLPDLADLLESPRFRLALDALADHRQDPNPRLAAVRLWTGIEALMACAVEERWRLASVVAALLEPRGPARRDVFESVVQLDAMRARVILSELLSAQEIEDHVGGVRTLLARVLGAVVEAGRLPTAAELDQALFG